MIRSSPWTSTSCWSSGENSTWSPTLTWRTLPPTARASPHTSRLATWAVAGIRMPPVDRRSPSSLRRETSSRSCSIWMGRAPAGRAASGTSSNATRTPHLRHYRCKGGRPSRLYSGNGGRGGPVRRLAPSLRGGEVRALGPAEGVELVVVDAEVVRDLVDDGDRDLLGHLVLVLADVADRLAVDHDPVRQGTAVVGAALGERVALVEPEQVRLLVVPVLDQDDDVVQQPHQLLRHLVERLGDQFLEALDRQGLHQLVGSGRPSS